MIHKELLKNTCYYNQPSFNQNWVHIDQFSYGASNDNPEGNVYVDGYDLVKPVNYCVDVRTGSAVAVNSICIVLGQKLLSINSNSFAVV